MMMLMIVIMAALAVMVVMMMLMVVIMAALAVMVVMMLMVMAALTVMVMVLMVMLILYFIQTDDRAFHRIQDFLSSQLFHRSCDDRSFRIQSAEQFHRSLDLFRCRFLGIRTAQNNRSRTLYLILKELSKVSQIHLALHHINNRRRRVQRNTRLFFHICNRLDDVRQLAYSGRLNDNTVRMIFCNYLAERLSEISHQRTTDTTGIHLTDLDSRVFQKSTVNSDLSKLILNQNHLLTLQRVSQKLLDQRRLSSSQKTGDNVYSCHFIQPLLSMKIPTASRRGRRSAFLHIEKQITNRRFIFRCTNYSVTKRDEGKTSAPDIVYYSNPITKKQGRI